MNFKGKAKRIDDIDLPMVGAEIGVGEDEVHAVLDVESAGSGFDKQGRPKMLFEPHVFWRELGAGPKRDRAAKEGLAYPRWKPGAYPKDSYPRLQKAMDIDPDAALKSASWGLGQIMGFNHVKAGYPTALAMVQAFLDDEENHLRAMIRFIQNTGLADELRRHDWKGFALGYNGAGFAKNGYDRKLRDAFAKWQKIKDTPVPSIMTRKGRAHLKALADDARANNPVNRGAAITDDKGSGGASALTTAGAASGGALVYAYWAEIKATLWHWADIITFWN